MPDRWFAAVCLSASVAIGSAGAETHERVFDLGAFDPVRTATGLSWRGAYEGDDASSPWLGLRVAVPAERIVTSAHVEPVSTRHESGMPAAPAPALPAPFTTGYVDGVRFVTIPVAPVLPDEAGGMRVVERFRVRIELAATPNGSPSLRRRRPATEALRVDAADWWIVTRPRSASSASVAGRFDPTARPSLEGSAVDMVIVTDESLRAPFDGLANWRTRTGTRTVVRTVDWILANYAGSDVAERIRLFLRDAYVSWGTQYALLGGDTEFIPVRYARSFYGSPAGADIATDFYYACLDGDWNADGDAALGEVPDAVDFQPDIYVGRLPASSVAEATTMTNKVMWYHGADPARFDDTYQETISFWAEALFWPTDTPSWNGNCAAVGFDGARIANWTYQNYVPTRFYPSTNLLYETYACWPDTNYVPIAESRASVIADFNSGRHLVVHIGHGFRNIMAVGASNQQLFNADADAFTNGDRLSIVYAVNCNSGAVDFDAIGEHLLTNGQVNGNGGAVAVIAATDLDYPATSEDHLFAFFANGFSDSSVSVPVGEEFFETTRQIYSPFAANADNAQRWTSYSLILLADPSMRVWSALPSRFQVFAESFYEMGAGPFQVTVWEQGSATPVPDARVTIYKEDDVFVSAFTNASGVASLDFQPSSLEGFSIGVVKDNYVPFTQDAVVVAPLAAPALTVDGFTVDDATGNQNGTADRAESVSLAFDVSNVGTATATNVALSVSTTSPFASVTQPNGTVGTLGTGASAAATPVTLAVSAALPDSVSFVSIPVTVAVTSDQGNVTVVRTLVAGNPRLVHAAFRVVEVGDGNGTVDIGETGKVVVAAFNRGQGSLLNGRASLSAASSAVSVTDGEAPIAPAPGVLAESDTLTFDVVGAGSLLFDLSYVDDGGTLVTRPIELEAPDVPAGLLSKAGPGAISLSWDPVGTPDAAGYNVYRVDALSRALTRVNGPPTQGAFFTDIGLTPLSPFSYTVTSVDSSGNESAFSDTISASTSPPSVGGFPLTLQGGVNRGSVTFVDLDQDEGLYELVLGSSYLTVVRGDATEYIDGDDRPATVGVFSEVGFVNDPSGNPFFWAKPAVADVDGDDVLEILAVHFKTGELYCWDATGTLEWGGPSHDIGEVVWSSPAIGNIDDDPEFEIVLWTGSFRTTDPYRGCIIAFNHDGTEVLDGDGSGATNGVLWKSPNAESEFNYSSVALADLDGDGRDEIVAGEKFDTNGQLHVLDLFGGVVSEMPGWPYDPNPAAEIDQFSASPALADVDGDGALEIFAVYLRGLAGMEIDGTPIQHMGSPVYPKPYTGSSQADFNDFLPSPVIGDFDGDGELDVVHGWHSGQVYAYTAATGVPLPGWPVTVPLTGSAFDRCLFNGVLANVDGDPEPEFVSGSGGGNIVAVNADGSLVGGFPFGFGDAVYGAPSVWDVNRNGSADVFVIGNSTTFVGIEMTGVPSLVPENAWPQFRHDPRNSGVYGSGLGPTPIDLGSVVVQSLSPGRVDLRWRAPGNYDRFTIDRAGAGEARETIGVVTSAVSGDRYAFTDRNAPAGTFARYWITGESGSGSEEVGPFGIQVLGRAVATALHQNHPNPFNPVTRIDFDVSGEVGGSAVPVRLDVYDVGGRLVQTLVNEGRAPGAHTVRWGGRDAQGRALSSGVFLMRLTVGSDVRTRKLILAR